MSAQSSRLGLPYLASGQAQKHVTVNESLLRLDALVHLSARSATLATQPTSPSDGDVYILPAGKTGAAWSSMSDGALAYYRDGAWEQLSPKPGWRCYVEDRKALLVRDLGAWFSLGASTERRMIFTPGGAGVTTIYRIDTTRVQNPRTATISSVSSDVITLATADATLFFNDALMRNVSYLRIWNTTKNPDQSAWVKESPANNQLKVTNAAAISGWSNGDTIQIGDPIDQTPNRVIALDISPMMQNVLGRVFRQSGIMINGIVQGSGVVAALDASEAAVGGSFVGVRTPADGALSTSQFSLACSVLSPVSDSNLVFLRENVTGTAMQITGATIVGFWV
jgi:hypothetical protein